MGTENEVDADKELKNKEKKFKKIITGPSSPLRRKTSMGHLYDKGAGPGSGSGTAKGVDGQDRALDTPHLSGARSLHGSATCLVHDLEMGGEQRIKSTREYNMNKKIELTHNPSSDISGTIVKIVVANGKEEEDERRKPPPEIPTESGCQRVPLPDVHPREGSCDPKRRKLSRFVLDKSVLIIFRSSSIP